VTIGKNRGEPRNRSGRNMVASMRAAIGNNQGQFDRRIPERSRRSFFIIGSQLRSS